MYTIRYTLYFEERGQIILTEGDTISNQPSEERTSRKQVTVTRRRLSKSNILAASEVSSPENAKSETKKEESQVVEAGEIQFPNLDLTSSGNTMDSQMFNRIPVQVTVELGQADLSLREILDLTEGSIIQLDRLTGEPLDLMVNGQLIAQGEVVAIDDNYGLRITKIFTSPSRP